MGSIFFTKWQFHVLSALHTVDMYRTVTKQIICLPLSPTGNKVCSCSMDKVVTGVSSRSSFSVLTLFEALTRNTHFRMCRRSPAKFVCNWSATPAIHTNRRWTKSSLDLHRKDWHIHKIQHTVHWKWLLFKTVFSNDAPTAKVMWCQIIWRAMYDLRGETFCTPPGWPRGPPSLLNNVGAWH